MPWLYYQYSSMAWGHFESDVGLIRGIAMSCATRVTDSQLLEDTKQDGLDVWLESKTGLHAGYFGMMDTEWIRRWAADGERWSVVNLEGLVDEERFPQVAEAVEAAASNAASPKVGGGWMVPPLWFVSRKLADGTGEGGAVLNRGDKFCVPLYFLTHFTSEYL